MALRILFYIFLCVASSLSAEEPAMQTVQVPMDVYLPEKDAQHLPCILIRSPAGRQQRTAIAYTALVANGYAIAIQATRSFMDSTGKTIPYRSDGWHEHQDGYDTVEWLAKQPWTNGKIGTLGFSAQGITQLLMAPSAPPSLKCQYIGVAAPTLRDHAIFPNGKLLKHQVEAWLGYYAGDTGVFNFVASQQFYDPFWEEFDSLKVAERVNVPAIFQGGWYDIFIQGTLDAFVARQERGGKGAKGRQKLIVGPWTHFWPAITKLGDFEVPAEGRQTPMDTTPLRWFDHYLKGLENGVEGIPAVTYYVMGPFDGSPSTGNVWRYSDRWPVPAEDKPFYLAHENGLTTTPPTAPLRFVGFDHDPNKPVPTIGGHNLFIDSGPMDQRPIEGREDVVVFSSAPLSEDMEVTGRVKLRLFVSSDCCDTDFIARLSDVYPDGRSLLITDGAFRTGLISLHNEERDPKEMHEIEIDMSSTSIVFAKGHQVRISISGSNYPRYELNQNIGFLGSLKKDNPIAHNKIYFNSTAPSSLILPIVSHVKRINTEVGGRKAFN